MVANASTRLPEPEPGSRLSARELLARGERFRTPPERLREQLIVRLEAERARGRSIAEALRTLFPRTILPTKTYEDLVTALLSGAHVLFFGPSGAGKTSLAKELWSIFPKRVWAVPDCPVQDHPYSIVDAETARRAPPCPICVRRFAPDADPARFDPSDIDAGKVPAEYIELREGFGFARLQGSSEVFPDYLTGNLNLRRLEEVGDPMSPLVLEPGKLLQANRGLLLIDEIGKLPLGTQNVLLQALQEGSVTPAKSRESFPGSFIAVCTSNLSDLDNINDPLSDRLTSLYVGYNARHDDNLAIVRLAQRDGTVPTAVPEILVDAGVRVIETWRLKMSDDNPDVGEVGSNRTLLDVTGRTAAIAELAGRPVPTADDLKDGLLHAMRGRLRARSGEAFRQNESRVAEFIDRYLEPALQRSALVYWCRYYRGPLREDSTAAQALVSEGRRLRDDPALLAQSAGDPTLFAHLRAFDDYVRSREPPLSAARPLEAAMTVYPLLEKFSLFTCDEVDDDAPL